MRALAVGVVVVDGVEVGVDRHLRVDHDRLPAGQPHDEVAGLAAQPLLPRDDLAELLPHGRDLLQPALLERLRLALELVERLADRLQALVGEVEQRALAARQRVAGDGPDAVGPLLLGALEEGDLLVRRAPLAVERLLARAQHAPGPEPGGGRAERDSDDEGCECHPSRPTLEDGPDGTPSDVLLGRVLRGVLPRRLREVLVLRGAVLRRALRLLVDALAAQRAVADHVAGGLLAPSEQLVEQTHRDLLSRSRGYPRAEPGAIAHKKISPGESEDLPELNAGSDDSEELPDPTNGTLTAPRARRQGRTGPISATCGLFGGRGLAAHGNVRSHP